MLRGRLMYTTIDFEASHQSTQRGGLVLPCAIHPQPISPAAPHLNRNMTSAPWLPSKRKSQSPCITVCNCPQCTTLPTRFMIAMRMPSPRSYSNICRCCVSQPISPFMPSATIDSMTEYLQTERRLTMLRRSITSPKPSRMVVSVCGTL